MVKRGTVICALAFVAVNLAPAIGAAQVEVKFADALPKTFSYYPGMLEFKKVVEERTKETLTVKLFTDGVLGDQKTLLESTKVGAVDISVVASQISQQLVPEHGIFGLPFVWLKDEDYLTFLQGPIAAELGRKMEAHGLKVLCIADGGVLAVLNSKRPVRNPDDMKGLKIRVPETVTITHTFRAWGAAPTPVAAAELYLALKQGVVDGQDNGFDAIAQAKYYEVQKYVTKIDYIQSGLMVLISADRWSRLGPAQQKALLDAAAETEAWASPMTNEGAAKSIEFLRKQGMEIVEPDLAPFKKLAAEALAKFDGDLWSTGLLEKVQAVR